MERKNVSIENKSQRGTKEPCRVAIQTLKGKWVQIRVWELQKLHINFLHQYL